MERLIFPFAIDDVREEKSSDGDLGIISGYASVFDVVDYYKDVVDRGAFVKTLKKKTPGGIPLLWQHYSDEPIGNHSEMAEDEKGLKTRAEVVLETQRGKEGYALAKRKVVRGLSIGFETKKYEYDTETGIRHLKEVDLWEVSLVTFAATPGARVTSTKDCRTPREMERALREVGLSQREAVFIASRFQFGLRDVPDDSLELYGILEELRKINHQ